MDKININALTIKQRARLLRELESRPSPQGGWQPGMIERAVIVCYSKNSSCNPAKHLSIQERVPDLVKYVKIPQNTSGIELQQALYATYIELISHKA